MHPFFMRTATAAAIFVMLGQFSREACAQATTSLDEVTITSRTADRAPLIAPTQQLSGAALTQRQGSTLGETLDNLPGIANSSFGPNVGRPVIHGLDGERVLLLQNGGANMDVSGLSFDHAVPIDPLTTERIEVLQGPETLLYGGGAMGGVVNVIDNRISRERAFEREGGVMGKAELRTGGAARERSNGAMVETGNDRFALHVDAFDRGTQNLQVPKDMACRGITQGRVCNSASATQGGAVGGTLLFDQGYLGFATSDYRSNYGTVAEPTVTIDMRRLHHQLEGELRELGPVLQALKFQWGRTNYTHTEWDGAVAGTRFDNVGHDVRVEARQRAQTLGRGLQLDGVVGLQSEANRLATQGSEAFVPASLTQSTALFGYQALKTDVAQFNAAVRTESVSVQSMANGDAVRFPESNKQFQPLSVAVGAARNWREDEAQNGWQTSSHVSWRQRAPKDYELFAKGPHAATGTFEVGNSNLGLEKGTQLDAGAQWQGGPHKAGLTAYTARFGNYLSLQPADVGAFSAYNPDHLPGYQYQGVQARFVGLESNAKLRMVGGQQALWSANAAHGAMDLELRGDVVRADDLTHNQPMPRIAPMRVGTDAVWTYHAWGARFGFTHAAAQNRVPDNGPQAGVTTQSYTMWNAGVNYHTRAAQTNWMLFAKLDNLTNKLAYSSTSVLTQTMATNTPPNAPPLAGRSLKLGLQVSF
jgi:iron complex outermembrane receptor protein